MKTNHLFSFILTSFLVGTLSAQTSNIKDPASRERVIQLNYNKVKGNFSTNTLPDSVNDQQYYIRDIPAKPIGKVKINISDVPQGRYFLKMYKIGYKVNDPYSTYLALGRPRQLTKQQVAAIKKLNDGSPLVKKIITVNSNKVLSEEMNMRENDVFLVTLTKL